MEDKEKGDIESTKCTGLRSEYLLRPPRERESTFNQLDASEDVVRSRRQRGVDDAAEEGAFGDSRLRVSCTEFQAPRGRARDILGGKPC